jgi:phosphatidylglycerophosphate synthase
VSKSPSKTPAKKQAAPKKAAPVAEEKDVYQAPEGSLLFIHVLTPFYNFVVHLYPRWWTPNGITVFGILCTTFASILFLGETYRTASTNTSGAAGENVMADQFTRLWLGAVPMQQGAWQSAVDHDALKIEHMSLSSSFLSSVVSPAILIAVGVLNLVYCVADNTDGKQARRLGSSSAVGEYLDHGLDCVTALMSTFVILSAASMPLRGAAFAVVAVSLATGLSHTLNYRKNIFIWGNKFVSVDEAMLAFGLVPIGIAYFPAIRDAALPNTDYRVVDAAFGVFLVTQVQMAIRLVGIFPALVVEKTILGLVALIVALFGAAYYHGGGTAPATAAQFAQMTAFVKALGVDVTAGSGAATVGAYLLRLVARVVLSYPAAWVITYSTAASIICHIPIAAKCRKLKQPSAALPLLLAAATAGAFWYHPGLGLAAGVGLHSLQLAYNIVAIVSAAAQKKRK